MKIKALQTIFLICLVVVSRAELFDVSGKNFFNEKPVLLNEGWIFYPNAFYTSKEIKSLKNLKGYRISATDNWHELYKRCILEKRTGFGTYHARIKINRENPRLLLKFEKIYSSVKIYVNDQLYASVGVVSDKKETYKPAVKPIFIEIDPKESELLDITLHVSNFNHFEGGIVKPPILGAYNYLINQYNKKLISDAIVIGIFFITGIIFMILYNLGKSGLEFLIFSLFSIFFTTQYSIYSSEIFSAFFQGIKFDIYIKFGYLFLLFTFSSFVLYIYYLFPRYANKRISIVSSGFLAGLGLIGLFVPSYLLTLISPAILLGLIPTIGLYMMYIFSKTIFFNENEKLLTNLGSFSLLLISFYFINNHFKIIENSWFVNTLVFFLFLCIHIYLLMSKYSNKIKYLYKSVEESVRAKNEFISTMSHELRTPLNGILGNANILKSNENESSKVSKLETIIQNTEKLTSIIDDILNLSDLETGNIQLKYSKVNIREVIEKSVELTNHFRKDKSIDLEIIIDPKISETLVGDELRLKQIFIHFISNAFKFTSKGKVIISGKLLNESANTQSITFSITDTGIGISKERLKNMFEAFKQADGSHTRRHSGIGLGLALSNRLIDLMGGKISVESHEGKGTKFSFTLTLKKESEVTPIAQNNIMFRKLELDPKLKILVAEDNPVNQKLMVMMLKNLGYNADIAENGKVAYEKSLINMYDIIFMDIQMPEMDGLEATKRILSKVKDRPVIIAVTANATDRDRDECMEAGMNDFVSKPVKPLEIKDCILKWQGLRLLLNENKMAI